METGSKLTVTGLASALTGAVRCHSGRTYLDGHVLQKVLGGGALSHADWSNHAINKFELRFGVDYMKIKNTEAEGRGRWIPIITLFSFSAATALATRSRSAASTDAVDVIAAIAERYDEEIEADLFSPSPVVAAPVELAINVMDGEPRVSTLAIADYVQTAHATVIKLVRSSMSSFNELGFLRFEIQENRGTQGAATEFAWLNERQTTLLLTFMRNTERVKECKIRLVKEFHQYKDMAAGAARPDLNISDDTRALMAMVNRMAIVEHNQNTHTAELAQIRADFAELTEKLKVEDEYFAVVAFYRMRGVPLSNETAKRVGMRCATVSRERGVEIGKVSHPMYGQVNSYHRSVLEDVFAEGL